MKEWLQVITALITFFTAIASFFREMRNPAIPNERSGVDPQFGLCLNENRK